MAIDACRKATEIKPDDAAYRNNYAIILARAKRIPDAQRELAEAARLDPQNAGKYHFNLGAVLVNNGQNDAAGAAFQKAIEVDSAYAEAHYQYGVYLLSRATIQRDGKPVPPAGTRQEFETYLRLAPNGANAESARSILATLTR